MYQPIKIYKPQTLRGAKTSRKRLFGAILPYVRETKSESQLARIFYQYVAKADRREDCRCSQASDTIEFKEFGSMMAVTLMEMSKPMQKKKLA